MAKTELTLSQVIKGLDAHTGMISQQVQKIGAGEGLPDARDIYGQLSIVISQLSLLNQSLITMLKVTEAQINSAAAQQTSPGQPRFKA